MKQMQRLLNWFVVCGVALAMASDVSAQSSQERKGKVIRVKGAARYSTGNNVWQPLKVGTSLKAGAIVQTAADSYADIVFGDPDARVSRVPVGDVLSYQPVAEQDLVRVSPDSVLAIDKLTVVDTGADQVTETQLDLRAGKVFGTVKKLSAASRYEVKIPNGVAGIRGTIYTLSAAGVVQVLVGQVVIAYTQADGTVVTQVVNGGYQFDARTGLVTPIPDYEQKTMVKAAKEARIGPKTPPTTFVVDQTIYYVSPRLGFNSGSGPNEPGGGG